MKFPQADKMILLLEEIRDELRELNQRSKDSEQPSKLLLENKKPKFGRTKIGS